jgi:hypothetical protein
MPPKPSAVLSPASCRALGAAGSCGRGGRRGGGRCAEGEVMWSGADRALGRCARCATTHVLISDDCLLRRRELVEVVGAARGGQGVRGRASPGGDGGWGADVDGARVASSVRGQRGGDPGVVHRGGAWPGPDAGCARSDSDVVGRRGGGDRGGRPGGVAAARSGQAVVVRVGGQRGRMLSNTGWH